MNKKASGEVWYARFFYPGLIAALTAAFFWLARNVVLEALGAPAAAPWFMGFIIGAIAGGPAWFGDRAGSAVNQKRERTADSQGFTGGWQLALINAVSALVLQGLGGAHLVFQSPTVPVAAVLGIAVLSGWALFRFVTSVCRPNPVALCHTRRVPGVGLRRRRH